MKIEIGDRLWFGEQDDGVTDSVVVDHVLLTDKQSKELKDILKENDIDGINKVDAIILLRERKVKK